MTDPGSTSTAKGSHGPSAGKIMGTVFAVLVGVVFGNTTGMAETVHSAFCHTLPNSWVQRINADPCVGIPRPVSATEGQDFIDSFLATASGSNPENAWPMLATVDGKLPNGDTLDKFVSRWDPTLWAQRVGEIESPVPAEYNAYVVQYVDYTSSMWRKPAAVTRVLATTRSVTIHLEWSDNRVKATSFGDYGRDLKVPEDLSKLTFAPTTDNATVGYVTRRFPSQTAKVALPGLQPRSHLQAICVSRVSGASGPEWWAATYVGFVSLADTTNGNREIEGFDPVCDPHWALRVGPIAAKQG